MTHMLVFLLGWVVGIITMEMLFVSSDIDNEALRRKEEEALRRKEEERK